MDLFKWVPRFIVFVFICIILYWITLAVLAFKGFTLIEKKGLKNVITDIWEGHKGE